MIKVRQTSFGRLWSSGITIIKRPFNLLFVNTFTLQSGIYCVHVMILALFFVYTKLENVANVYTKVVKMRTQK